MSRLDLGRPRPIEHRTGSRYEYGIEEGYDWIGRSGSLGYVTMSAWGLDGWDLGQWPYVIIGRSKTETPGGPVTVLTYVEGDLSFDTYGDRATADKAVDSAFLFYANDQVIAGLERELGGLPGSLDEVPDRYRGPFSWHRLNVSQRKPCPASCRQCELTSAGRLDAAARQRGGSL